MSLFRIACFLTCTLSTLAICAAEPPSKPTVKKLYGLGTPSGWLLDIHDDGSAQLTFGAGGGLDQLPVPAGTFQPAEVRKALDEAKYDPEGYMATHFAIWYEEERKSPAQGPKARYTADEKVIVPLFEKADAAYKRKYKDRLSLSRMLPDRPGFGLKK